MEEFVPTQVRTGVSGMGSMLEILPELTQVSESAPEGDGPLRESVANPVVGATRLSAELQSLNDGLQGHVLQALVGIQRSMEIEFKTRLDKELRAMREELVARLTALEGEIHRASMLLESISAEITLMMDDPNSELSRVMRKRVEESVLRSYLDGLKFAADASR